MITALTLTVSQGRMLLLLAAILCAAGSWVTVGLLQQAATKQSLARYRWLALTGTITGSTSWIAHLCMLATRDFAVPTGLPPVLTFLTLLTAIAGSALGFVIATGGLTKLSPLIGGAMVGVSFAVMHFVGSVPALVQGAVVWHGPDLLVAATFAIMLAALATHLALVPRSGGDRLVAAAMLFAGVVSINLAGMTGGAVSWVLT